MFVKDALSRRDPVFSVSASASAPGEKFAWLRNLADQDEDDEFSGFHVSVVLFMCKRRHAHCESSYDSKMSSRETRFITDSIYLRSVTL